MLQQLRSKTTGFAQRLLEWIFDLPPWLRPVAYGALFIVFLMALRGVFVLAPILLVLLLLQSHSPGRDLLLILLCFAIAIVGGGLSGLMYSLIGRWVAKVPLLGPSLAGILTVSPYMLAVSVIVGLVDHQSFNDFLADGLLIIVILSCSFGPIIGHMLLRPGTPDPS